MNWILLGYVFIIYWLKGGAVWKVIKTNEVWSCDNYFSLEVFAEIEKLFEKSNFFEMAPGEAIKNCFRAVQVNPTLYHYRVHYGEIRESKVLVEAVYRPVLNFCSKIDIQFPKIESLNPLQLFLKSFSNQSFYDVHVEPIWRYGDYAFLIFMDDCAGGELVFPSQNELNKYLMNRPEQRESLNETVAMLKDRGEIVRTIGPVKIKPEKNKGIIFKVGSIHWVEATQETSLYHRKCVAGWPFATESLIEDLDKHCKIKTYFKDSRAVLPESQD